MTFLMRCYGAARKAGLVPYYQLEQHLLPCERMSLGCAGMLNKNYS